ncbi:hypothetical protein IG631_23086 [Alternaria alternata]|nr:hypothetical protein IG631_23086 [Alternaria alternata]
MKSTVICASIPWMLFERTGFQILGLDYPIPESEALIQPSPAYRISPADRLVASEPDADNHVAEVFRMFALSLATRERRPNAGVTFALTCSEEVQPRCATQPFLSTPQFPARRPMSARYSLP